MVPEQDYGVIFLNGVSARTFLSRVCRDLPKSSESLTGATRTGREYQLALPAIDEDGAEVRMVRMEVDRGSIRYYIMEGESRIPPGADDGTSDDMEGEDDEYRWIEW